ncbi:MAG: tRNA (adenosine(37)-N6)-threonylcarbamoyltransferase complex ATPase subunit type 1 TsaE [Clostridiales bacterium]|nr:tRNA (adenosine(37)-N6)-threonylcarbamoyltransferase complex ATPase subunit type 1 TsaE [Clostridiales bacterium]
MARLLNGGDVLLLKGDMGAGKSELARGIARGLGITGPVPSPSFTILNAYDEGRVPFHHFDWYRVNGASELTESGLDEFIGQGITVIEWPERAPSLWPEDRLEIAIVALSEQGRSIDMRSIGNFRTLTLEGVAT